MEFSVFEYMYRIHDYVKDYVVICHTFKIQSLVSIFLSGTILTLQLWLINLARFPHLVASKIYSSSTRNR